MEVHIATAAVVSRQMKDEVHSMSRFTGHGVIEKICVDQLDGLRAQVRR